MAEATLSGYKTIVTATITMTVANDTWAISSEIDNSTNKYLFGDFEVVLGSAAYTGADSVYELYIIPSVDGTNYPDFVSTGTADEQENQQYAVGSVTTSGTTAVQRMALRNVALPNGKFKIGTRNRTNATITDTTTASSLKYRPHQYASA